MPLIHSSLPNLINGVSQQPATLRLSSQATEQINGYSSVVEGLRKRAGTIHAARLPVSTDGEYYVHTINRDIQERYQVLIDSNGVRVFTFDGEEREVKAPDGIDYLASDSPKDDFRCVTVADYTFILNTKKTVEQSDELAPERPPEALIWVREGTYSGNYTITINDEQAATYQVPDGSESAHANYVVTDYIAGRLEEGLRTSIGADFRITRLGSSIWIRRDDEEDFDIRVDDSVGDTGLSLIKGQTQSFSDLPVRGVDGMVVKLSGDTTSKDDDYYVAFKADSGDINDGVWEETVKGGEVIKIDPATMPHALVRESDGTFTFRQIDWKERLVGDLDSNPMPSFVGRSLNDMFFHRNRLGFVADENIVMSKAGDFFNLFRETVIQMLDDDPIDVGVSHVKVSILRHAIPFNETLLLFSDQTQFQLGSTQMLTPETISINQTTEYECSLRAKPVGVGQNVYFAINRGGHTGIREYYVDKDTESEEAEEITAHVPKYIPGGVFKLAASSNEEIIIALSDQVPNEAYVYKFYYSGQDKMQASWSRWNFGEDAQILNADFIESRLHLVIQRPDGVHLEYMDVQAGAIDEDFDIEIHLDSKVSSENLQIEERTDVPSRSGDPVIAITLPYTLADDEPIALVCKKGDKQAPGQLFTDFDRENDGDTTVLIIEADLLDQPFVIGRPYEFRYTFSDLMIRQRLAGGSQQAENEGRLQIRKASLVFNRSGYFRVEVTPTGRETYKYIYAGKSLGVAGSTIGEITTGQGIFNFPVFSRNNQVKIELVNDSYLPSYIMSAMWEGFYNTRSRAV